MNNFLKLSSVLVFAFFLGACGRMGELEPVKQDTTSSVATKSVAPEEEIMPSRLK